MSLERGRPTGVELDVDLAFGGAALASLAVVAGSYLYVLYEVASVVGGVATFLFAAAVAAATGAFLGRVLSRRAAFGLAVAVLAGGLAVYLTAIPQSYLDRLTLGRAFWDTAAMLTGYSAMRLARADLWVVAVTPGPTLLVAYFAARREYVRGSTVAVLTLGFFVLTGDATVPATLFGVLAAAAAVGFGTLARVGATRSQVEALAAAFAVMILAATAVSAVPGGGASPLSPDSRPSQVGLVSDDERVTLGGSLDLSATVRFVVDADRESYWRVSAYDRFTGQSWIRTGSTSPVSGRLDRPPGPREPLQQVYEAKTQLSVLPAAPEPLSVGGVSALETAQGTVDVDGAVSRGRQFTVTSLALDTNPAALQAAGRDYPAYVNETYLQVPASTSDRVRALAANVTATADTPYESATAVERWLEANKEYSLSVPRAEGNVVDQFLFEMNRGYCVYYASAMVVMLRTQGIPARYVTGFTPGQRIDEDTWVVRDLDAHAWVEVYFPDVGWVRFDPTPGGPRRQVEQSAVEAARESGAEDVDAAGSENETFTTRTRTASANETSGDANATGTPADDTNVSRRISSLMSEYQTPVPRNNTTDLLTPGASGGTGGTDTGSGGMSMPSGRMLALWGVLVVGVAAGLRRSGVAARAYREAWLRWQPRTDDPTAGVEAAYERAEYVLARRHRERRDGETVREYLASIDAPAAARRLATVRERARYAGQVDEEAVATARELASSIVSGR